VDDKQKLAIEEVLAEHSRWAAIRTERLRKASDLADRLRKPGDRSFAELEAAIDELKRIIDPTSPEPLAPGDRRHSSSADWRSASPSSRPSLEDGRFDEDDDDDDLDRPNLPVSRR
jgi:hypothetical protein